jgi:DNA-binding beta-propeller fold protein YncE
MRRMTGRAILSILLAAFSLSAAAQGALHTLYAASVRSGLAADAPIAGNLYTINLASGTATLVGAIRLPGSKPIGVTGMAVNPKSGVFYGITSEQSPNHPRSLVTLDPATGNASLVAELQHPGSDIAFDSNGTLYMWLPGTGQIGTVNTSNGTVTALGKPNPAGSPAGVAIDSFGMIFVTAKGAAGTLDNIDLATGALQQGPALTGAPFESQINSMSFSPSGLLLAVNSNAGSPANTRLVTINTATGVVSTIGALPDDTDALAFSGTGPNLAPTLSTMSPGGRVVIGVISAVLLVLAGMLVLKNRKE